MTLKRQPWWLERMRFGHSFGIAEKQRRYPFLIPGVSSRSVTFRVRKSRAKPENDSLLYQNAGVSALLPSWRPDARSLVLGERR